MQIIRDIEQLSPEWFALRAKRMTASPAQAIASAGKGLKTYINKMMNEYFSEEVQVPYTNEVIQNGVIREPIAADIYKRRYDVFTEKICFVIHNEYVGASPDLFVGENGLGEIKCPSDRVFLRYARRGKIVTKYLWQMQMQMLVCEKEFCDYIVYNPNFKKDLIVERVYPDATMQRKLRFGFKVGTELIKEFIVNRTV